MVSSITISCLACVPMIILSMCKLVSVFMREVIINIPSDLHNNTGSRQTRKRTKRSNDTLVDTPFQLISGFFHVNQGVLCSEHTEQASFRGVLEGAQQAC